MPIEEICSLHHQRLLEKLTRRTEKGVVHIAHYKSLVELYGEYNQLIKKLEEVKNAYEDVAIPVRSKQPLQYIDIKKIVNA